MEFLIPIGILLLFVVMAVFTVRSFVKNLKKKKQDIGFALGEVLEQAKAAKEKPEAKLGKGAKLTVEEEKGLVQLIDFMDTQSSKN